jgi:hypothetical protein
MRAFADTAAGDAATPLLRLRQPVDVLMAVPYLLGFHPRASIVLLGLTGPRNQVSTVVRADLPRSADAAPRQAAYLAGCVRRAGADRAVVACYADGELPGLGVAVRTLLRELAEAFDRRGLEVIEQLLVEGGRWRSALCVDSRCCPPEGLPVPTPGEPGGASLVAAVATYAGLTPLAGREQLAERVRADGGAVAAATRRALERRAAGARHSTTAGAPGQSGTVCRFAAAVTGYADCGNSLDVDTGAALLAGLTGGTARDACLAWVDGHRMLLDSAIEVLADLTRRADAPYGAAPAALLAFCAWQRGEGALANVAADRALTDDPGYRLARLLAQALASGLDPAAWQPTGSRPLTPRPTNAAP